jgi:hypothetical protein
VIVSRWESCGQDLKKTAMNSKSELVRKWMLRRCAPRMGLRNPSAERNYKTGRITLR